MKVVVSEPETKKSYQLNLDSAKSAALVGKKIGDEFSGDILGLVGYVLKITGGTDKDGFPMVPSVKGPIRKKILLSGPPGFHPRIKGQRKRKTVHGDMITADVAQVNTKVVKKGEKPLEELLGKTEAKSEKQ